MAYDGPGGREWAGAQLHQNEISLLRVTVITGAIFVASVLLFRRGIVGELTRLSRVKGLERRS